MRAGARQSPPIRVGEAARAAAEAMRRALSDLQGTARVRRLDAEDLDELHRHSTTFYDAVREDPANAAIRCGRGCSACCSQMVYGVRAMEVEVLGRHLRRVGRVVEVRDALRRRLEVFDAVRLDTDRRSGESEDDREHRIALRFFAEDLPCVFLEADGSCGVHSLRPHACRRFFSLSDPALCTAEGSRSRDHRAVMIEPLEDLDERLEVLDAAAPFDPESDLLDRALLRWLEHRS